MKKFYVGIKAVIREERGILLLKTNEERGSRWEFPGGRIEGNEGFEATLTREVTEELPGSTLKSVDSLLGAHRLHKDIYGDTSLLLLIYLAEADLPEEILLSDEHELYIWVRNMQDIPEGINPEIENILHNLLTG